MTALPASQNERVRARILIGAAGGASIITLPRYLVMLRATIFCHITMLMTAAAENFLPSRTMSLFADQVIASNDVDTAFRENHVKLAAEHDLIIVFPATAHVLAEAAHGFASSPLTTVILASPQPVIYIPAMNKAMWSKQAVQRNVETIRNDGGEVVDPVPMLGFEVGIKQVMENPSPPSPSAFANLVKERLVLRRAHDHYVNGLSSCPASAVDAQVRPV